MPINFGRPDTGPRPVADICGELGYFQHSFQVYDREGEECKTNGCAGIVKRFVQNGRSTFWCPKCQK